MQTLIKDERFIAQTSLVKTEGSSVLDWGAGATYENVAKTIRSVLGFDYPLHKKGAVSVQPEGLEVYDILSNVLPFASTQSTFFWTRFCKPYASMLETANYPLEAQIKLLTFFFARVIGLMGPDERPVDRSFMTIDGSPAENSWVIPTGSQPVAGEVNRALRFSIQPTDPRTGKLLRGSKVLDWFGSAEGGLGVVTVKDGWQNWRRECDFFFFGEDDSPEEYSPPGTVFFVGFTLDPKARITLKAYYMPSVRTPDAEPLVKSPVHILDTDFRPLTKLMASCHPSLVDQFQVMLEYFDGIEDRMKPVFHFVGVDEAPLEKNRLKIYFQTRVGFSFNDVKRHFTLGGRLNTPEFQKNVDRFEMLWNLLFPSTPSDSGLDAEVLTNIDANHDHRDEHPVFCFGWYYEFAVDMPSLVPKVYFPARHYCLNDMKVFEAMQAFYDHPTVDVHGPPDGEHGEGWIIREAQKSYNHRPLEERPGLTTWVTFGCKHGGYEMMTYFSPEIWVDRKVRLPPVADAALLTAK
ncbi:tryptophan dimethylallyltransferase-domain-containing protein [Pterulicium gracile]|uniref:Tryptophan dimethylallyltransferase-domain-containing protein n=1 Tax=Pterulicium gracile TaxID=1884261 RepID=A0A5C3QVE6_9AGAR|nr:tryptophan dimethylallyltransferase-domain-containing protein [Pterula gracilis]